MDDLLTDFVAETREMLEASESEIIAWEANPADRARLDAIFRFVHTVKGNCGFFDFPRLAALSHAAEDALADCRSERRLADATLVTAVLAIVDRIALMVDAIEAGDAFPDGDDEALIAALAPDTDRQDGSQPQMPQAAPVHEPASALIAKTDDGHGDGANDLAKARAKKSEQTSSQRSIRLPVDLLDRVMSGVSDMVLARNDLAHRLQQAGAQPTIDGPFERLTSILADVRDAISRMRMQRIETLFAGLPRLVRDLSSELGKQVMIDLEGGDVELDREVIETIRDPLTHLIRNAIDHGIENPSQRLKKGKREIGMLSISARQSGNSIAIMISDDGRGLSTEKIADKAIAVGLIDARQRETMSQEQIERLIFEPGFSTADTVSSVSGRGVGLDVVCDNLEKVGGKIAVSSTINLGTVFTLQVPLTLSIIAGLTVEVSGQRFAIPQSFVEEVIRATARDLDFTRLGETAFVTFRGRRVPCLMLSDILDLKTDTQDRSEYTMVLLRLASGDQIALAVDAIYHHGDIVIKPLAPAIMKCGLYAGTTLLDDGQPVLLLEIANLAARYGLVSDTHARLRRQTSEENTAEEQNFDRVMLFTDWQGRRCAIRLELVQRIETVLAADIERSDDSARAVMNGVILPLIGLPKGHMPADKVRMLRLSDGECELLYAVRNLEDAAELTEPLKHIAADPLIEALTLIDDTPRSLINGHALFAQFGEAPQSSTKPTCQLPDNEWARTILKPLLDSAGYEVAAGGDCDVTIVLDDESPSAQTPGDKQARPVIRLRNQPDPSDDDAGRETPTIYRYDRQGVLAALKQARAGGNI